MARARRAAAGCQDCDLWRGATQTVFGEGKTSATIMLVGEQPGDREDIEGRPFVGPAGALLDRVLAEAGIDRASSYTTNVVKHFKYRMRGRRRIHQRPGAGEVAACRQWIETEIELVSPRVLVCLGATATAALLGRQLKVERDRGRVLECALAPAAVITIHPSAALRAPDSQRRELAIGHLIADLEVARLADRELALAASTA